MMLVIHPQDVSTDFLGALYEGMEVERLMALAPGEESRVVKALRRTPAGERLMMLGHGGAAGLLSIGGRSALQCVVGAAAAPELKGRLELVGIWCHAKQYAETHGLKGLWSGMIISEVAEAELCMGVRIPQEEVTRENEALARHLRRFLDTLPLAEIPARMKELVHSPLTEFNYNNFYYYG